MSEMIGSNLSTRPSTHFLHWFQQFFYNFFISKQMSDLPKRGTTRKATKGAVAAAADAANEKEATEEEATEYRRSGASGGTAKSTITGRGSAMFHFNKFLETKKMPSFEQLKEDELCCIALFQEYGTYLSEFARKRGKVKHFDPLILFIDNLFEHFLHNRTNFYRGVLQSNS